MTADEKLVVSNKAAAAAALNPMPFVGQDVLFYREWGGELTPMAAKVVKVWSETMVNVVYFSPEGEHHAQTSVSRGTTGFKWDFIQ